MKANELQIGDWVKVLPISRKTEAHNSQVGALTRNVNNTISIEGGYFPAWTGWSVGEEYIEPIPLTKEILEKNGFNVSYSTCYQERYCLFVNDEEDCVEYKFSEQGKDFYRLKVYIQCGEAVNIHALHVHELQHALRMCGLNDLADNFKVD